MNAGSPSLPKAPQMRHIPKSWSRPESANHLIRPAVGKVTQQTKGTKLYVELNLRLAGLASITLL